MSQASSSPTTASSAAPKAKISALGALWPFVRPHSGLFVAWLVALGLASTATLTFPVAFRRMIDDGFSHSGNINQVFALVFAVVVVLALASAARFFFVSLLGEKVVADLRTQLYRHLITLDAAFHDRNRSGELVSRLAADSELLRNVVCSSMSIALRNVVIVSGAIAMLFITSPRLALFTLIGIPLAVLPIMLGARRLAKASRATQDRVAEANHLASETLGAISTVQAHARQNYESERFAAAVQQSVETATQRIRIQSLVTAIVITLIFGAVVLVLWSGAHDVINGRLSAGELGQFVFYALLGGGSIGMLMEAWNEVQRAAGGMGRIAELLHEQPTVKIPATPQVLPLPLRGEIHLENVHFHYPQRLQQPALHNFNLHVRPGETVALVGPSGAGKSTVLALLLRFYDPTSGTVRIDGVDLRQLEPQSLREHMALVPQQPALFATSAADNIRYGRLPASDEELQAAARAAEADDFIRALPQGYASFLGERGTQLSGGQQQRIAIARAVLKNTPILLLDEATSALDAHSERAVQHALERLMNQRTTLVIAHRLATVLRADRIVVMDRGQIVAQGRHDELLAQGGLYTELAKLQFID